ncbi:hypothetical protein [Mycobacterium sp. SMC-4]|uniref:hypothetical protein n=1 Tax=Mycobacterium sp. SMC-4 TaxID=2857059 RepID=UPI003D067BB8
MTTSDTSGFRSDVKSLIETAAGIAGFGAVLSALMFYFGWVRTRVLFDTFGVPVSLLDYSTSDYVMRSAEVFFKPAVWTILAVGALAAMSAALRWNEANTASDAVRRSVRIALAVTTAGLLVWGVLGIAGYAEPMASAVMLCLSGALVVMQFVLYRTSTRFRPSVTVLAVGVLLVLAAAFWAVSIYAGQVGAAVAEDIRSGRLPRPATLVTSTTDLGIAGAQQPTCQTGQNGHTCRYSYLGYSVLTYANDRWFLIRQPSPPGVPTVVLPDTDSVRVDVAGS